MVERDSPDGAGAAVRACVRERSRPLLLAGSNPSTPLTRFRCAQVLSPLRDAPATGGGAAQPLSVRTLRSFTRH